MEASADHVIENDLAASKSQAFYSTAGKGDNYWDLQAERLASHLNIRILIGSRILQVIGDFKRDVALPLFVIKKVLTRN